MKLAEAIAWLTTEGRFDTEGHCCPKSSEAVNTLLDALRNEEIFTFEEVEMVPKAFHDRCMQIEIAKRKKLERPNGTWRHYEGEITCSECGSIFYDEIMDLCDSDVPKFCPNCGAVMIEEEWRR